MKWPTVANKHERRCCLRWFDFKARSSLYGRKTLRLWAWHTWRIFHCCHLVYSGFKKCHISRSNDRWEKGRFFTTPKGRKRLFWARIIGSLAPSICHDQTFSGKQTSFQNQFVNEFLKTVGERDVSVFKTSNDGVCFQRAWQFQLKSALDSRDTTRHNLGKQTNSFSMCSLPQAPQILHWHLNLQSFDVTCFSNIYRVSWHATNPRRMIAGIKTHRVLHVATWHELLVLPVSTHCHGVQTLFLP